MQHFLCAACSADKTAGVHVTPARYSGRFMGPAETTRVTFGIAKQPKREQRVIAVNGEEFPMSLDEYNCDNCNASIRPGDRCCAFTAWRADQPAIDKWEAEYLEETHG